MPVSGRNGVQFKNRTLAWEAARHSTLVLICVIFRAARPVHPIPIQENGTAHF
jgi:hypothetical protein